MDLMYAAKTRAAFMACSYSCEFIKRKCEGKRCVNHAL